MNHRFRDPLEPEFQLEYAVKSLPAVRAGLILGALLYLVFTFVDPWVLPRTGPAALAIRMFFAVPILLGAFLWTYHRSFLNRMQAKLTAIFVLAASGVTWILALSDRGEPGYFVYSGGLVIAIMFTASLFRLQLVATAIASLTIFVSHTLVAIFVQGMTGDGASSFSLPVFISNTFFLGSSVLVALMTSYTLEVYARRDFAQQREIRKEKEATEGKNRELIEALDALEKAQSELVQSERMAALGSLVAGLVHELASPVGVIRASADLAEGSLSRLEGATEPPPKRLTEALVAAHRASLQATDRISAILKSLRNFSRLDRSKFAVVDVREGLEDAITLLGAQLRAGVSVERKFGDIPKISCQPAELNQAFMYVLQNAVEAMGSSGTLTVETWSDSDLIYVRVSDEGPGIEPEVMKLLFVPTFRRTGSRVKAGMGLFVSHQIVERHGGRIEVVSEMGHGTTVTIELPCTGASGIA